MGRSAAGCLNMCGNVAEWTQDKSVAGGSYHSPLKECTVDSVEQVRPESRDYRVGFRVARN
jgi:formylglycine-generating enzyme required for sulfatase activity